MACKESMVVAPLVVLLYDRAFTFGSVKDAWSARKRLYTGLSATWVLLGWLMWSWPRSTVGFATAVDPWTYLLNQVPMIRQYLRLSVWPDALVLDYGIPRPLAVGDVVLDALLVLPLLIAAVVALLRWPAAGFLGAVFFLTLAPTSSVVPIDTEVGAERRMYVPMMALSVLVATAFRLLVDGAVARAGRWSKAVVTGATVLIFVVLATLGYRTILRNEEYSDRVGLWRTVVERRPHGRARFSYASALISAGDHERARAELGEAVRDYEGARYALGVELIFAGDVENGIQELRKFVASGESDPNRIPARSLLARTLASKGDLDGAVNELRAILELAPTNVEARVNLAEVLLVRRQYDQAAAEFQTVADRVSNPAVEVGLGTALMEAGRPTEAAERLEAAVKRYPASAGLRRSLVQAYLRQSRAEQAVDHAREAVRLDPKSAAGHNLLGAVLASRGEIDEAIEHFREAVQLDPSDTQARENLARAESLGPNRAKPSGPAR
jgi:Flp pilus assembly protein TadD